MSNVKRVGAATASGTIAVIAGILGALSNVYFFLSYGGPNFFVQFFGIIPFIVVVFSFIFSVLGFVGGIIVLSNKKSGLVLINIFAIASIVLAIGSILTHLGPDIINLVVGVVLPIVLLILNSQKKVRVFYRSGDGSSITPQTNAIEGQSEKKKIVAFLLCFFLGELGIHRFYAGKTGTGVLYLLTLGLFGIGWLVDLIMILSGNFKDKSGNKI